MSHTTAAATVLWGVFLGETTTVISVGEREAREVVDMAFKHAKVLEKLGSKWAKCRLKGDGILFERGGRVLALPASSGGRGFSGNVFLDEFAYLEKPKEVWDGAAAVVLHGYSKMRVSSTPNGVGNAYHNLWTNPQENKGWVKHQVSLQDALAAGMEVDIDACWKMAKGDPRVFSQLFECSFLDGNEQYIPTKLILDAREEDSIVIMGDIYAGYDVGLENDLSAMVILRQTPDNKVWVQSVRIGKRVDWHEQKRLIFEDFDNNDIRKLAVDQTGMGTGLVSELQMILGRHKVEGVKFSLQSKEEMATDMYQGFAAGMVRIPYDEALVKDLISIRRIITDSGNVRYDAAQTADGHADRAWALALAIHACTNKPGKRVMRGPGDFGNT